MAQLPPTRVARTTARRDAGPRVSPAAPRRALADEDRHARAGTANGNAKVTERTVRAWRAEAVRVLRARLKATGGRNARTGEPLAHPFRGTGLFVKLARAAQPPVSVAAVSMAVHGETWSHVPGALPRYVAPNLPAAKSASRRPRRG